MKKHLLKKTMITAIVAVIVMNLYAQQDIILDPAELIPADTGYYIGGVNKDKNNDGEDEHYNGCSDEYGDAIHNESGEQQGFTYNRCMIMPTCWPKDAVEDHTQVEIDHAEGYIELTKSRYAGTDSASLGYIITPSIANLVSITLETSPDVSSNDSRQIIWWVEYSKDNGATWENTYFEDETTSKKGDEHTYDGSVRLEFQEMIDASAEGPIVIRIMSKPEILEGNSVIYNPQRVKIHYLKIVAELSTGIDSHSLSDKLKINIINNTIHVDDNSEIKVYSMHGQLVGEGKSVTVKDGIYIVRTEKGVTRKVFVE